MSKSLDDLLVEYFHPEKLKAAFKAYEEAKTDFFESTINVPMGADGISYETFARELDCRCRFISNRVLKGTYQFYPFRQIDKPKPSGGERVLSIATIRDVLVQKVLYDALYNKVEKKFQATPKLDKVSCAYRKRKSAPYAATLIHRHVQQGFIYALDADIVKFFDRISHPRLIALIEENFGRNTLATNLLRRFVKTGGLSYKDELGKPRPKSFFHEEKPNRQVVLRTQGIPQGGVLSGMLANFYLHEFDCWVVHELSSRYNLRYVRYADDFVLLLKESSAISLVHEEVTQRLQDMELELHSEPKTKYVDIAKNPLEFVGFQFTLENIKVKPENINKFKNRVLEKICKEPSYRSGKNPKRRLKVFIQNAINKKVLGRGEEICPLCSGVIGERVKSWMGFFAVVTDIEQLRKLDKWIRREVSAHFYKTYQIRLKRSDFKTAELASLEQEYYRLHKRKACSCEPLNSSPDSDSAELQWEHLIFVKTLFLALSFFLLSLFSWLLTPDS